MKLISVFLKNPNIIPVISKFQSIVGGRIESEPFNLSSLIVWLKRLIVWLSEILNFLLILIILIFAVSSLPIHGNLS